LSADDTALLDTVARDLTRRGLAHEIDDGRVRLAGRGENEYFGLSNLAQLCHMVGRAEWETTIAGHFDNLLAAEDAERELEAIVEDFEAIRALLKVRLYSDASMGGLEAAPPASWAVAPGLTATFVFDLPTTVRTASPTHVESWGKSRDELLDVALGNVRTDPVEAQAMSVSASGPVACFADHFFAASHALLLAERLPPSARGSAVFAVPHRHALLYAPVVDLGVVDAINRLIPTAVSMFRQGPGSISPGLYWWRESSVTLLPSEFDGRNVNFAPPDEFVEALNVLPSPA
jgi:hypothetical protein